MAGAILNVYFNPFNSTRVNPIWIFPTLPTDDKIHIHKAYTT